MKTKLSLAALTALNLFVVSGIAQFDAYPGAGKTDSFSEVSVTFYAEPYFRGESITLSANTAIDDLRRIRLANGPRVDNRISSVWIEGHAQVTLYERDEFAGDFITLTASEADLSHIRQGRHRDWDNEASSIAVSAHHVDSACDASPRTGSPHPTRSARSGGSIAGYPHARSPHDLGSFHRQDPAVIRKIERAYRDVLRRRPDRDGRRTYYTTMVERGWSESRLRRELRKSQEYHQHTIPAVVQKVYREVLNREPDPAGFQFYSQKMSRDGWYESHLRKALKRSPEYASRTRS
jgi:hypothetical protein